MFLISTGISASIVSVLLNIGGVHVFVVLCILNVGILIVTFVLDTSGRSMSLNQHQHRNKLDLPLSVLLTAWLDTVANRTFKVMCS